MLRIDRAYADTEHSPPELLAWEAELENTLELLEGVLLEHEQSYDPAELEPEDCDVVGPSLDPEEHTLHMWDTFQRFPTTPTFPELFRQSFGDTSLTLKEGISDIVIMEWLEEVITLKQTRIARFKASSSLPIVAWA